MATGKPTPKPKYKTYKRGEAGTISNTGGGTPVSTPKYSTNKGSGSSQPQASTPSGSIGGTFDTGATDPVTGQPLKGYADASVEQIKSGPAEAQGGKVLYSKTYKGGSGKITTPSGQPITIQQREQTTYSQVQQARQEELRKSGGVGLSNKQLQEYQTLQLKQQPRKILVDYEAVDRLNKEVSYEDLKNARLINGKIVLEKKTSESKDAQFIESQKAEFYPPRTIARGETTPIKSEVDFKNPFPPEKKYGGVITADFIGPNKPSNQSFIFEIEKSFAESEVQAKYLPEPINLLSIGATEASKGFLETTVIPVYYLVTSPVQTIKATTEFFVDVASNPIGAGIDAINLAAERPAYAAGLVGGIVLGGKAGGKVIEKVSPVKVKIVVDENIPGLAKYKGVQIDYPVVTSDEVLTVVYEPKKTKIAKGVEIVEPNNPVKTFEYLTTEYGLERRQTLIETPYYKDFLKTREGQLYKQFQEVEISFTPTQNLPSEKLVSKKTGREINTFKQPPEPEGGIIELGSSEVETAPKTRPKGGFTDRFSGEFEEFTGGDDFLPSGGPSSLEDSGLGKNPFDAIGVDLGGTRKQKVILIEPEAQTVTVRPFAQPPSEIPIRPGVPIRILDFAFKDNAVVRTEVNPLRIETSNFQTQTFEIASEFLTDQKVDTLSKTSTLTKAKTKTIQNQAQAQTQNILQISAQAQTQTQATKAKQAQKQLQKVQQITTKQPPPKSFFKTKETTSRPRNGFIQIEVRKKGLFKSFGTAQTPGQAQAIAENIIENTASASYRLREEEGNILENIKPGKKYYASRKEKGVLVQRNKFRIDTPGEKSEITFLGMRKSKAKTRVKNIFGGR